MNNEPVKYKAYLQEGFIAELNYSLLSYISALELSRQNEKFDTLTKFIWFLSCGKES